MLRDVVGGWLDVATERELDAPLLAMLVHRGFSDVHLTHGAFEFGKDAIAKRDWFEPGIRVDQSDRTGLHQWALQSKAGDIGLGAWREIRSQLDEARLDDLAHPSFDGALPRVGVLVLTGRLRGAAAVQAQSYRESERRRGNPDLQIWDRETLLEWLVDFPASALTGAAEGPLLGLLAAIDDGSVDGHALERFTRRWLVDDDQEGHASGAASQRALAWAAVEAAVVASRLRESNRCDLAAFTALSLLRAVHAGPWPAPEWRRAALAMFAGYAETLLDAVEPVAADERALIGAAVGVPFAHVPYLVVCQRLVEILGLLGLLSITETNLPDLPAPGRVLDVVGAMAARQPGVGHLPGDAFAVSLLGPLVLLSRSQPSAARALLTKATVWLADRHDPEKAGIGLAPVEADTYGMVHQLLSGPLESAPDRRTGSYAASVLLDLATVLQHQSRDLAPTIFTDVLNDLLAAGACPELTLPGAGATTWRPDDPLRRMLPRVHYMDPLPADGVAAAHQRTPATGRPAWDMLALSSVARDRHDFAAVGELACPPAGSVSG